MYELNNLIVSFIYITHRRSRSRCRSRCRSRRRSKIRRSRSRRRRSRSRKRRSSRKRKSRSSRRLYGGVYSHLAKFLQTKDIDPDVTNDYIYPQAIAKRQIEISLQKVYRTYGELNNMWEAYQKNPSNYTFEYKLDYYNSRINLITDLNKVVKMLWKYRNAVTRKELRRYEDLYKRVYSLIMFLLPKAITNKRLVNGFEKHMENYMNYSDTPIEYTTYRMYRNKLNGISPSYYMSSSDSDDY